MPAKKKAKKGKKSKKSKKTDGDEDKKEDVEEAKIELPSFGWIKITVSNIPTPLYFAYAHSIS